jgi:hypothetical protein
MGSTTGDSVPQPVIDQAKKTAQDLLAHPDKLPDPVGGVVTDAKKFPDKVAADFKNSLGGKDAAAGHAGDGSGTPGASTKRPGAPHVTGAPDVDPHVKLGDGGRPDLRGSSAGGHVTVAGKESGVAYSATAHAAGGVDAQGHPELKAGGEAGVTIKGGGGPDGPPQYSAGAKIEGGVDATHGGSTIGKVRGTAQGEVQLGQGVSATAGVSAGVDGAQRRGQPDFEAGVGLKFTPGASTGNAHTSPSPDAPMPKSLSNESLHEAATRANEPGLGPKFGTTPGVPGLSPDNKFGTTPPLPESHAPSPGELLAAKIQHDHFLAGSDQITPGERKLAAARATAEEKVMSSHPEFGSPTAHVTHNGLQPGDYSVAGKDGANFSGDAVKLPDNLQKEVQTQMNVQNRADTHEQVQERGRSLERSVAGPGL